MVSTENIDFKDVPVLKFMEYDRIVVFLNGRPEMAYIEGGCNNYHGGKIYHISAPAGTVADLKVVSDVSSIDAEYSNVDANYWENRKHIEWEITCLKQELNRWQQSHSYKNKDSEVKRLEKEIKELEISLIALNGNGFLVASNIRIRG